MRLYLLMLAINVCLAFVTEAYGEAGIITDFGGSSNLEILNEKFKSETEDLSLTIIPLGDFIAAVQLFFNIIGGGYIIQMLQLFDLSSTFVSGIQVIIAFITVLATIYFISGRGSM